MVGSRKSQDWRFPPVLVLLSAENCCSSAHGQHTPLFQDTQLSMQADDKQLNLKQPELMLLRDWFSSQFKSQGVSGVNNMHGIGTIFNIIFSWVEFLNAKSDPTHELQCGSVMQ